MTIEISDTLADRFRAAAAEGAELDLNHYAIARLERSLADEDFGDDDLVAALRERLAQGNAEQ